jgi:hypothetical protein
MVIAYTGAPTSSQVFWGWIHLGLAPALDKATRTAAEALGSVSLAADLASGQQLTRQMAQRLPIP